MSYIVNERIRLTELEALERQRKQKMIFSWIFIEAISAPAPLSSIRDHSTSTIKSYLIIYDRGSKDSHHIVQ